MQVIIDETRRLSTLVNAVLELSKARSSAEGGEPKRFDLTQTVRGIMTRYAKLTEQDGYHIVFEPESEAWVIADEVQAQQVIYNLINDLAAQGRGIIVISSDMEEIIGITWRNGLRLFGLEGKA